MLQAHRLSLTVSSTHLSKQYTLPPHDPQLELQVCDSDTVKRSELIGRFAIDLLNLYYKPGHEL